MHTLLLATRNAHKVAEIRSMLVDLARCLSLLDLDAAPAVIEDQPTFAGNAAKKAVELAQWLPSQAAMKQFREGHVLVVADDSGLEVDALNGQPGVHSARFAALDPEASGNCSDAANNAKLLRLLEGLPPERRTARFRCVMAAVPVTLEGKSVPHGISTRAKTELFEGVCEGWIDVSPRGSGGFGYDPLFVPRGYERSFAELTEDEKNQLSHRGAAVGTLRRWLDRVSIL